MKQYRQFASNKEDLEYLTNLVCAAALACFGLTLTDSQENQKKYSELVSGFGEHWKDIHDLKSSADMDTSAPELKEWAVAYMASDHFSTYNDVIDWNNDDMAEVLIHRAKSFEKIDLYRVIMALIEIGAFESVEGNLTKKKVFKAFADMLGIISMIFRITSRQAVRTKMTSIYLISLRADSSSTRSVKMKNSRNRVSRRDGKTTGGVLIPRPCSLLDFLVLAVRYVF